MNSRIDHIVIGAANLISGTKTFLVGESFMRASDPGEELQKLFFS